MSYAEKRQPFEFTAQTKQEALQRSPVCEACGNPKNLHIDHILPVFFALKYPVFAIELIKSLANARVLCKSCHSKRNHYDTTEILSYVPVVVTRYVEGIRSSRETTINGTTNGVVFVAAEQLSLLGGATEGN